MQHIKFILLVEDNLGDARLIQYTLKYAGFTGRLQHALDGDIALKILNEIQTEGSEYPDFILLDLNLPKKSGIEILEDLKTHEHYKKLPVFILTSSESFADRERSRQLDAMGFFSKPINIDGYQHIWNKMREGAFKHSQLDRVKI